MPYKFSKDVEKKIAEIYLNNEITIGELAKRFGCCDETISNVLERNGISRQFRWKKSRKIVTKKRIIPIPESTKSLTLEKAWVLGVLAGDAHLDIKNARIILESGYKNPDKNFIQIWKDTLEKLYGIKCRPWKRLDKIVGYVLTSRGAANDLIRYGSFGRYKWIVPSEIISANRTVKCFYLRGFFDSEGCVPKNKHEITAKSVNYDGLEQIKNLLEEVGIHAKITGPHEEKQKRCLKCHKRFSINKNKCSFCGSTNLEEVSRSFYLLRICGYMDTKRFFDNVGFRLKRKQKLLENNLKIIPKFLRKK